MTFDAKKLTKFANLSKETSESSASNGALFKEEIPTKMRIESAAGAEDTLMGRLASRMASRDMIDELDLGPKGRTGKQKEAITADNSVPSKMMMGPGLHEQTRDLKASNFSNPIPNNAIAEGNNMAEQAKSQGNVFGKNIAAADFSSELKKGIEVEMEHTKDPKVSEKIARDHLKELPDYYTRLVKMEKEGNRAKK